MVGLVAFFRVIERKNFLQVFGMAKGWIERTFAAA
jgi:hypothetical protein